MATRLQLCGALTVAILSCLLHLGASEPNYVQCDRTTDRGNCASTDLAFCSGRVMGGFISDVTITTFPACVRPGDSFTLALSGPVAVIHANKGTGVSSPSVNDGNCPEGVLFDRFGSFSSVTLTAPNEDSTTMEVLLIRATGNFQPVSRQLGSVSVTSTCPTPQPTQQPTSAPTTPEPTFSPTTPNPTFAPTTPLPSTTPTAAPSDSPTTPQPTKSPAPPLGFFEDPANVAAVAGGSVAGVAVVGAAAAGYFLWYRPGSRMEGELKNIDM